MRTILKSLGGFILLIGVGILAIPAFTNIRDNTILLIGLGLIILGFIAHIILNKKFE